MKAAARTATTVVVAAAAAASASAGSAANSPHTHTRTQTGRQAKGMNHCKDKLIRSLISMSSAAASSSSSRVILLPPPAHPASLLVSLLLLLLLLPSLGSRPGTGSLVMAASASVAAPAADDSLILMEESVGTTDEPCPCSPETEKCCPFLVCCKIDAEAAGAHQPVQPDPPPTLSAYE